MYNLVTSCWKKKGKKKKEREDNLDRWTLVCCEGKMRRGKSDKSNRISLSKKFRLFYTKKLTFSIVVAFLNFNFLFFILFFPYLFFFFFFHPHVSFLFSSSTPFPYLYLHFSFFSFIYSTLFGALSSYLHFSFFFSSNFLL